MLIHNKVYNHRKKQKRLLEKQKLAKKGKTAEKHIYLGSWRIKTINYWYYVDKLNVNIKKKKK